MPQIQENFIRMAQAVTDVLDRYRSDWSAVAAFQAEQHHFESHMEMFQRARISAQIKSTGATEDKDGLKEHAIMLTVNLAKRASVYALNNRNMELFEELNVNKAPFRMCADNLLLAKMRRIQFLLIAVPVPMEAFSISSQNMQDLDAAISSYERMLSKPRDIIVERKMHHYTANQIIIMIREVLMKMDRLINIFSGTAFEHEYKSARITINLGIRHNPPPAPQL